MRTFEVSPAGAWRRRRRAYPLVILAILLAGGALWLAACTVRSAADPKRAMPARVIPVPTQDAPGDPLPVLAVAPVVAAGVDENVLPVPSPTLVQEAVATPAILTLTMWTTEVFSPLQNDVGAQILKQQFAEFAAKNPNIALNFVLKKAYGKGGMSDFLQTTGAVVPQGLPDLAIIDAAELPSLARVGLLRPLTGLVSPATQADLFPFAYRAGTVDGQLVGLVFEAEVIHLAYNTRQMASPPLTWADVLSGTAPYIFPAGGEEHEEHLNDAFWLQYLATGGNLDVSPNGVTLDSGPLEQVFDFYAEGVARSVIPRSVLDYRSEADSWPAFLSGKAAMTNVSSLRYLASRGALVDTAFAPVPTRDGRPFTLARGWALIITAKEPARQEAAGRVIDWLLQPEHNGVWTRATDRLPASRRSLATWDLDDAYVAFLKSLLEIAEPCPTGLVPESLSKLLQRNVRDVLTGAVTPKEAAAAATASP